MAWLETVVTSEPATEPVTLAEAKAQCRVETSADDDLLNSYIKAARIYVERYCGIRLITQTVAMRCSCFADFERLSEAPLISVTSVAYLDTAGTSQTLATTVYENLLYGLSPSIRLKPNQTWPGIYSSADAITVTASAGFGAASAVPAPIAAAMKLLIAQWYDNRTPIAVGESVNELPNAAAALLANYRRF